MKAARVNSIILSVIFLVIVSTSASVQAYTVVPGHPRVDIRPDDLEELASRALVSHLDEYNTLKNFYDVDGNHDDGIQTFTLTGERFDNIVIRGNYILSREPGLTNPLLTNDGPMGITGHSRGVAFRDHQFGPCRCRGSNLDRVLLGPRW